MKKVFTSLTLLILTTFGLLVFSNYTKVNAQDVVLNELASRMSFDMGLELREEKASEEYVQQALAIIEENASEINFNAATNSYSALNDSNFTFYGGTKYFLGIDLGFYKFHLRSVGDNVEVWVADNLSYAYDRPADVITQEQVDLVRDEFENNIYPKDTEFFGTEDFHDGTESLLELYEYVPSGYYSQAEGKNIILVDNIKDDSYYYNSRLMISGFYWRTLERYIDRNIITIDSYAWFARTPNDNPNWAPYQYDVYSTIAHEYQHLIHDDNDPLEDTWINEGMSDFAQFLCGYGHDWGHINEFLNYPENSLVNWGDFPEEILADYGQAYLMQLYLNDHFGQEFIRALAVDTDHGINSMNKILAQFNTGIDFNELFRRFSIAVAIDSNQPGNGMYNFDSIDLKVNFEEAALHEKGMIPAWGGSYQIINETSKIWSINFEGQDFLDIQWQSVNDPLDNNNQVFWGNGGDELDNFLIFSADLRNLNTATLEFDHYMNIEEQWDFGFVQVSLDNGKTWISLSNENTRSDFVNWHEFPNIGNQLPGFTGLNNGYTHEVFDLTQFVGNQVKIGFRYMTDGAVNGNNDNIPGWFIDNISIPEINYYNDASSLDGFVDLDRLVGNYLDYSVAFINEQVLPNGKVKYNIHCVESFNVTEEDALQLRQLFKDGNNYMIIWYEAEGNHNEYLPFEYEIITKK